MPSKPKNVSDLRAAYLVVFDAFAASRSEVAADVTDGDKSKATRLLNKLRDVGLIATVDVNAEAQGESRKGAFAEVAWQAVETSDAIGREQAEQRFDAAFGLEPGEVEAADAATPVRKRATSKPAASEPAEGSPWGDRKPAKALLDYLKSEVTDAADAPNKAKPFINVNGQLHMHSSDWREWLTAQGIAASKAEAAQPLRDAGLKVRAFPLPGEGRSLGFYIGQAPKGTEKLPRRKAARRAAAPRPFGKLTDEQRVELVEALSARPTGETRDALLEQLTA